MADGGVRYAVEIESLADFLAFVDREMTTTFEPGANGVRSDLPHGQRWGGTVHGGVVQTVRAAYLDAHQRAVQNLVAYVGAGATMLDVIKRLMDNYRTSEALATLSTEDVLRLFDDVARERERAESLSVPFAV